MEKSVNQIEKNVSASFGYVKKDMLMLNDAFSDLHDKVQHLSLNHATLLDEIRKLRAELAFLSSKKKAKVKKNTKKVKSSVKKVKKDDLSKIEGIGSKIRTILYKNNILTYNSLAKTSVKKLKKILAKEGPEFTLHNPETWSKQAKLAAKNSWTELEKLQKELKGGISNKPKKTNSSGAKEPKPVKKVVETITYQ